MHGRGHLIAGGGSAGGVLAVRLSEDAAVSVCLVEAGADKADSVFIRAPLGLAASAPPGLFNWNHETVPQAGFDGRRGWQPRGKLLGGSSAINAMVYTPRCAAKAACTIRGTARPRVDPPAAGLRACEAFRHARSCARNGAARRCKCSP